MIRIAALGVVAGVALSASAPVPMTVREFLAIADRLPQNASAVLRPEGRRLVSEVSDSVNRIKAEQAAARRAGRVPAHCIPTRGTGITPEGLLARFRGLPADRREQTVTEAIRTWMAERHPCRS